MKKFETVLEVIGVNPFVFVPTPILSEIFAQAGKDKGHIPVCGKVNNKEYRQTLLKYKGEWRLYINNTILKNSPRRIGEIISITIEFDPEKRVIQPHPEFLKALSGNKKAKEVFGKLTPSRQKEIVRYISFLKTEGSVARNVEKAIGFLTGKNKFAGRSRP